ncbi:AraC family transcriptional regulator [Hypericibacter adhaerens]|uniref:AraC family transcriptional regulator n=2 Tax=Hypericibacter adhaerens TaxID=2602016 RepID=A0A5J6MRW5_9PROT|nr:AraC family transcriptional regulator [Hypericibacter adhaerens]
MTGDPFSDVIRLVKAQSVMAGGLTAGGTWAIRFPAPDEIKLFALVKGRCWLHIDGEDPFRLETGDIVLLAFKRGFILASDLTAMPIDAWTLFAGGTVRTAKLGDSEDCIQIGGHVRLDPVNGGLLADLLPPLIHIRAGAPGAASLQWLLAALVREQAEELPGASLASTQLAQLMFLQILRVYFQKSGPLPTGWLRAVTDRRLSAAIRLMHGEPGRPWRLDELARAAAMSRSAFAHYFKTVAGLAPLEYLTNWRMRLAERELREGSMPVANLARSLGYGSESAFSNAFKRAMGQAPKRYRSAARTDAVRRFDGDPSGSAAGESDAGRLTLGAR